MTLAEFLCARLDEAERLALDAKFWVMDGYPEYPMMHPTPWSLRNEGEAESKGCAMIVDAGGNDFWEDEGASSFHMSLPVARHVVAHDPARVLADIESKRAILHLHRQTECVNCEDKGRKPGTSCATCHHDGDTGGLTYYDGTCGTVRAMAQAFKGRAGWDASWEVEG